MSTPNQARIVDFLRSTELFKDTPTHELNALALRARYKSAGRGDVVFTKRVGGSNLYCVLEGRLKITTVGPRGNEFLLGLVDAGELCGEVGMVDGVTRMTNAIADRPSQLMVLNRRYVQPVIDRNPATAMAMSRILCGHLRTSVSIIENFALQNAQARLFSRLMSFAQRYPDVHAKDGNLRIEHGLSQQDLADSAGLTRVMVNRQLSMWRELGLIESGRGFVVFLDRDALEALVLDERD